MIILLLLSFVFSCKSDDGTKTIVLDDKEAFIIKLADLYFIDSWVARATKSERDSLRSKLTVEFEDKHQISVEDFHAKLNELQNDPKLYGEVLDSVGVLLNRKGKMDDKLDI